MRVPLAVPNLDGREAEYLQECVSSTFVSSAGPFVGRFQDQIATLSGTDRAVVTCSGTVALQMAFEGLGIGNGDLVMAPSLTFIATANAVRHCGADVWLVDSTEDLWTLDIDLARAALESETEPHPLGRLHVATGQVVRALAPVMIMGATLDFDAIVACAKEFNLAVVVDAAAAIGAQGASDAALGATGVDAVCYSFNGNKTVTSGGGGAVASPDSGLLERIDHLISTGRRGTAYEHDIVAYNFRMTNVEAAIGVAQLERLDGFLERKADVYRRYSELVSDFDDLQAFPTPAYGRSVHWYSGFAYTGRRIELCDEFRTHMIDHGVDTRPFWKPVHLQPPHAAALRTTMDVCEGIWERIVPLPCSTGITDVELEYVVDTARAFLESRLGTARG